MCKPFFHEFRVIPPANGFQLVCYTAIYSPHRLQTRGLTLIGVLLTLASGEVLGSNFYLCSDGSLQEQESRVFKSRHFVKKDTNQFLPRFIEWVMQKECISSDEQGRNYLSDLFSEKFDFCVGFRCRLMFVENHISLASLLYGSN